MINLPIFRAKKIYSDEYVEGCYFKDVKSNVIITRSRTYLDSSNGMYVHCFEIDPTTLSIHFSDSINTNSEKVWYNLEEISNIIKEYENGKMETN